MVFGAVIFVSLPLLLCPNLPGSSVISLLRLTIYSFQSAYLISINILLVHSLLLLVESGFVNMRLIIRDDSERASAYVANYIVERIRHFAPTPSHPFVLGLPTGSSPLGVYKVLVEKYKAGEVRITQRCNDQERVWTKTIVNCRFHSKMSLLSTW